MLVTMQSEVDALRDMVISDMATRFKPDELKSLHKSHVDKSREAIIRKLKQKYVEGFDPNDVIQSILKGD
jgi:hypothetical protein